MGAIEQRLDYMMGLVPIMLQGGWVSLQVFLLTMAVALPFGLIIAMLLIAKAAPLRWVGKAYTTILRGTPLLLQLFFVYYGLPAMGIVFDRFTSAVVAFILNYAAYFAEIYRGGIQSIPRGQYEAAKVLGFSYPKTMWNIIIPQTITRIMPSIANETITLVKDTALITAIGVSEMLKTAKDAVNRDVTTDPFLVVAVIYLVATLVLTLIFNQVEKKYSYYLKRE